MSTTGTHTLSVKPVLEPSQHLDACTLHLQIHLLDSEIITITIRAI